jgi:hypothetical protein
MQVFGASIDSVRAGYGAAIEEERPRGVPDDWVLRTATIEGRTTDYDELAGRLEAMSERLTAQGYYPHGWSIPEDPSTGQFGPAELTYWAPPDEEQDAWNTAGKVIGVAAAAFSLLAVAIGIMESQY